MGEASQPKRFFVTGSPGSFITAIIILVIFLIASGSGAFKAFSNIGQALGAIPVFVWVGAILIYLWFWASGGSSSGRRRRLI